MDTVRIHQGRLACTSVVFAVNDIARIDEAFDGIVRAYVMLPDASEGLYVRLMSGLYHQRGLLVITVQSN